MVTVRIGVRVSFEEFVSSAFNLIDRLSRREIELRFGLGEIQELAAVDQGWAGRPHVHFPRATIVEPLNGVLKLGATDNAVLSEKESLAKWNFHGKRK